MGGIKRRKSQLRRNGHGLEARVAAWLSLANLPGFHKPGSNKK